MNTTRRSLLSWLAPTVAVAVATPAAAASYPTDDNPNPRLVQTHFDVHPDNRSGYARVKFGYQGDKQGNGQPNVITTVKVFSDDKLEHTETRVLIKAGPSGPFDLVVPVDLTESTIIRYEVRYADGSLALLMVNYVTPPKWWKR